MLIFQTGGRSDNLGHDFIVVVWRIVEAGATSQQLTELYLLSGVQNSVNVTLQTNIIDKDMNPDTVVRVECPYVPDFNSSVLYIHATHEISAHAIVSTESKMAAYILLPRDVLGTNYYAITHCDNGICMCSITPAYVKTSLTIILPELPTTTTYHYDGAEYKSRDLFYANVSFGDIFTLSLDEDLSGTLIMSDYPIAVFCGGITNTGVFMEQMIPLEYYQRGQYITMPFIGRTSAFVKVLTREVDTVCVITWENGNNGKKTFKKQLQKPGDFHQTSAGNLMETVINTTCDKPVMVMLICDNGVVDGFMTTMLSGSHSVRSIMIPNFDISGATLSTLSIPSNYNLTLNLEMIYGIQTFSSRPPSTTENVTTNEGYTRPLQTNVELLLVSSSSIEFIAYIQGSHQVSTTSGTKTLRFSTPGGLFFRDSEVNVLLLLKYYPVSYKFRIGVDSLSANTQGS